MTNQSAIGQARIEDDKQLTPQDLSAWLLIQFHELAVDVLTEVPGDGNARTLPLREYAP